MTGRFRKLGTLVAVAATVALTLSATGAHAAPRATTDTDDSYVPANTQVTGTASTLLTTAQCGGHSPPAGTVTCFSIPGTSPVITVFCKNSVAGGKTPATGIGAFHISPLPTFDNGAGTPCTDSLGGKDTSTANETNGKWMIKLLDSKAAADETPGTEPNAGDKLQVTVPKAGVIVTNTLGCTITVAPSAAFKVKGAYDDVSKFTVSITNLPIITSGGSCPLPASAVSTFNAVYTFSPGVTDKS
jgi:hypothetical protein